MKVLFIGGTGIISSGSTALAVERGIELYLLNRGKTSRPVPDGAYVLHGDIRDAESVKAALKGHEFDAVVDFIGFVPAHVEADIDLFRGSAGQYMFISSASAYQTPPAHQPVTESTPLDNPFWQYSRDKIACEERLMRAWREENFPVTIVRPSHTYDRTYIPLEGGYTVVDRMKRGEKVVVHGDGTSIWALTHHRDFAKGLVGLLGNPRALGEAFHITTDEMLTWNQIHEIFADCVGAQARIVHIPSDGIAAFDKHWGESLLGDKAHSMVYDNSKIKSVVPDFAATIPFAQGAEEIIAWHHADPSRLVVNEQRDQLLDRMIAAYESVLPAVS